MKVTRTEIWCTATPSDSQTYFLTKTNNMIFLFIALGYLFTTLIARQLMLAAFKLGYSNDSKVFGTNFIPGIGPLLALVTYLGVYEEQQKHLPKFWAWWIGRTL